MEGNRIKTLRCTAGATLQPQTIKVIMSSYKQAIHFYQDCFKEVFIPNHNSIAKSCSPALCNSLSIYDAESATLKVCYINLLDRNNQSLSNWSDLFMFQLAHKRVIVGYSRRWWLSLSGDRNTHFRAQQCRRRDSRVFAGTAAPPGGTSPGYAFRLAECIAQLLLLFSQLDIYGSFTLLRA